jgi:hypothetical protein
MRIDLIKTITLGLLVLASSIHVGAKESAFQAWLIDAKDIGALDLNGIKRQSVQQLVISIRQSPDAQQLVHLNQYKESGLSVYYWIEVARDEGLASAHPEWMASIQGHPEWRRFYPDFPKERDDQMVKVFPWVPIFYQGAFEAQLDKVQKLLNTWPSAKGVFLNDLQGAPSACGCGHPLCRWTTDYGPKRTAGQLGHDAPAKFVQRIQTSFPNLECIPVWASECEAHDKDGWCAGVGCYAGACWREWSKQLEPLSKQCSKLGALLTYKDLGRDLDHYTETAGWVTSAIGSFQSEMKRYKRPGIDANRLIAVLQGWDVSAQELAAQIKQTDETGAGGYLIAKTPIHSQWEPKLISLKSFQK